MCKIRSSCTADCLTRSVTCIPRSCPPFITCTNGHLFFTMVKVIIKDSDTVVAEASETVYIEGNHYFTLEAIKVDLSISDTT
jgi:uncharacterized protein (DUF427 family)